MVQRAIHVREVIEFLSSDKFIKGYGNGVINGLLLNSDETDCIACANFHEDLIIILIQIVDNQLKAIEKITAIERVVEFNPFSSFKFMKYLSDTFYCECDVDCYDFRISHSSNLYRTLKSLESCQKFGFSDKYLALLMSKSSCFLKVLESHNIEPCVKLMMIPFQSFS